MPSDNWLFLKALLGWAFLLLETPVRWAELRWNDLRRTADRWLQAGIERNDPVQQYRFWAEIRLGADDLERQLDGLEREPIALLDRLVRLQALMWVVHDHAVRKGWRDDPRLRGYLIADTQNAIRLLRRHEKRAGLQSAAARQPVMLLEDGLLLAGMAEAEREILRGLYQTSTDEIVKALQQFLKQDWSHFTLVAGAV